MRKMSWIICLFLMPALLLAHGNKPGKAVLSAGDGEIAIAYIAPELKGRDINELIKSPGANPWRLGADRATTLQTPVPLKVDGGTLPAGSYTLRAFLDEGGSWWLQFVDENRAVAGKLPLKASMAGDHQEHLVIALSGSSSNASLTIQWGTQLLAGSFSAE